MIGFENVLSPSEQLLWEAYYALEPYGGELKYLSYILQSSCNMRKPFLPSECQLDVRLEDVNLDKQRESVKAALTGMVEDILGMTVEEALRKQTNG